MKKILTSVAQRLLKLQIFTSSDRSVNISSNYNTTASLQINLILFQSRNPPKTKPIATEVTDEERHVSNLDLENKLSKNELQSLHEELTSLSLKLKKQQQGQIPKEYTFSCTF